MLRSAATPLLLANPFALPERQPWRVKRILVPLDGSETSGEVLSLASEMARLFEAELLLLYSLETIVAADPIVALGATVSRDEANALLDGFARRISGAPVRTRVAFGPPAVNIPEVAREESADLIAMTSHGRSGVSRWAFGSVAEHVLRHAPCPVLVKRTATPLSAFRVQGRRSSRPGGARSGRRP